PYERAAGEVPVEIAHLKLLAPEQSKSVEQWAARSLAYEREAIAMLHRGERDAVLASIARQDGKRIMDAFRAAVGHFLDAQREVASQRSEESDRAAKRLAVTTAAGTVGVIALTVTLGLLFTRDVTRRLSIVQDNTLRLERGEPLHPPVGRDDEIAAVDRSFHEMAAALERGRAELEASNRELEAFSYSVSHDLRAPLRAVGGFAEILAEDHAAALDADGVAALRTIRSEARRMGVLIDDLLSFSRLGKAPLSFGTVDLGKLAREVWREIAPGDRATLDVGALPPARCDRRMIRHVLVNLLSNAVKFSRNKAETRVEIGGRADGNENVYWVRDNGAGFDMRYAGKLFRVFQRLHSDEEFEGTGVGLAIVQRVVARHGGRVWAESAPDAGACFSFTLPAARGEGS
ncbi:MAG TPA: ATP-binding protein, partial [Thermoanaerobaculia bacterium]|nr:ATP-binding protein [Thermoanaerobaculia bacterium]